MRSLHARAGIDYLGKYRSLDQERVDKALAQLGRQVVEPAVDRYLYRLVETELGAELNVERDNRSVTDPEWAQEGIARYGCPIHNARYGNSTEYTVSGRGPCSCSASEKRKWERSESTRTQASRVQVHQTGQPGRLFGQGSPDDGASISDEGTPLPQQRRSSSLRGRDRVFDSMDYRDAISAVYGTAGGSSRRRVPFSVTEVVDSYIDLTSYAGAPFWRSNRFVIDPATKLAERIIRGERGFDPYAVGRRVQPGDAGPKTRLVWMAPLPTTIVGTRFSKVVSSNLERKRPFTWGLHNVEKGAIIAELESRFRYVYSLDFSRFDSTVPARMIDDAFRVARTHLDLTPDDDELYRRYVNDFIHSRIITAEGDVWQKHKGVPSGSAFTSIVDSIVNLILITYVWKRATGSVIPHDRILIMGDDVVVASNTRLELSQLASYSSELGFDLSVEKCGITKTYQDSPDYFTNRTHFLGHYWVHGVPHRPLFEIVQRMALPEHHARRTRTLSLTRLKEYSGSSFEGHHEVFRRLYRNPGTIQACFELLRVLQESEERDGDVRVSARDLPGQSRLRLQVEGKDYNDVVKKGLITLLFGPIL
jgi:hypothetical protein